MKFKKLLSVFLASVLTVSIMTPEILFYEAAEDKEFTVALDVAKNSIVYANSSGTLAADVEFDLTINLRNIPGSSKQIITVPGSSQTMEITIPAGLTTADFCVDVRLNDDYTTDITFDKDGDGKIDYTEGKLSKNGAFELESSLGLNDGVTDSCLFVQPLANDLNPTSVNIVWATGLLSDDSEFYLGATKLTDANPDLFVTLHGKIKAGAKAGNEYTFDVFPTYKTDKRGDILQVTHFEALADYYYNGDTEGEYIKEYEPKYSGGKLVVAKEADKTTTAATTTTVTTTAATTTKAATTTAATTSKAGDTTTAQTTSKAGDTTTAQTTSKAGDTTTAQTTTNITTTPKVTTTAPSSPSEYVPYTVEMPQIMFAPPNFAGKAGGGINTPDGVYYNDGVIVADDFDGENYLLNGTVVAKKGELNFNDFIDAPASSIDFASLVDAWVNSENREKYDVYKNDGNYFYNRAKYCEGNTYTLKGTGNTLNAQDLITFSKAFIVSKAQPLAAVNAYELDRLYNTYSAKITDTSSENLKAYVEIIDILRNGLYSAGNNRVNTVQNDLQAFADAEENHDINVNFLLKANPDTL